MTQTAIAYLRVSTEEQATHGVSLDAQEQRVRAYCTMRGLDLVDIVVDAGVSGGKPLQTRPGGSRVVDFVKRGKVDHVVSIKLDRLFRDCADCLQVTEKWDRKGVALHLVDLGGQAVDTSSAMGRFFLTVMAGAAELERNQIRERTRAALAHKKSRGECVGQVPFGFRLAEDGVHIVADGDESQTIAHIRDLREQGLSIRKIADHLNQTGVPSRGSKWHPTTVSRILRAA